MEEKIFVGCQYGRFQTESGQMQDYCNAFVLEDFAGTESADYHFQGQKASKYKCVSLKVWADVKIGSKVQCYFDSKNRISYMVAAK